MSRKKAFWVSFGAALSILLVLYAAVWLNVVLTRPHTQAVAESESGVAVSKPVAGDSRNLFVVVKGESPLFFLIRFDAFQGRIAVAGLRCDTLLRAKNGGTVTLKDAWDYAGPGYAGTLCAETLGIQLANYLQMTREDAVTFFEPVGAVHLSEGDLDLAQAGGVKTRDDTAALSVQNMADLMRLANLPDSRRAPFSALCAARLCDAGADVLSARFDALLRGEATGLSTDIFANQIYEYTHILEFFITAPPACSQVSLAGTETDTGFELAESAPETAVKAFS